MLWLTLFARSFASLLMQHEQISDTPLITAPLITIFLARMPRRAMLILLMSLYAAGNLLSGWRPATAR
jgi:hypothetical protein